MGEGKGTGSVASRECGEPKEKNGSVKEQNVPEFDRILSKPCLYFGTEGVVII